MILDLNDYWYLSNEFSRLRRGPIVLVNKESKEVYGPGDLVLVEPSGEFIRAVRVLDRILQSREKILTEEERVFTRNFFLEQFCPICVVLIKSPQAPFQKALLKAKFQGIFFREDNYIPLNWPRRDKKGACGHDHRPQGEWLWARGLDCTHFYFCSNNPLP